jgi:hypothetical protein
MPIHETIHNLSSFVSLKDTQLINQKYYPIGEQNVLDFFDGVRANKCLVCGEIVEFPWRCSFNSRNINGVQIYDGFGTFCTDSHIYEYLELKGNDLSSCGIFSHSKSHIGEITRRLYPNSDKKPSIPPVEFKPYLSKEEFYKNSHFFKPTSEILLLPAVVYHTISDSKYVRTNSSKLIDVTVNDAEILLEWTTQNGLKKMYVNRVINSGLVNLSVDSNRTSNSPPVNLLTDANRVVDSIIAPMQF